MDTELTAMIALEPALAALEYDLPEDRIARHPPAERDAGRLLLASGAAPLEDRLIRDLPTLLRAGDLLVVNEVRVHRARLRARRATGGAVEVLLCAPRADGSWEAMARPGRRLSVGERLSCGVGEVRMESRAADGSWTVRCLPDVDTLTRTAGEIPLPPYLGRAAEAADEHRYQTVYARPLTAGADAHRAAAAPTAGLHFTPALLQALAERGVERATVSLEVGAGTFKPLDPAALASGTLHAERFEVPTTTWDQVERARAEGRRVIAIGTTAARVLESMVGPGPGVTRIFIRPGYRFQRVDGLLTNLHLPRSSLLLLVAALIGVERTRAAYARALAGDYRFFSYGDAMLLLPGG